MTLVPCPSCSRHVRSSEASCPFCAAALPSTLASNAVPAAPRRLERLAAFTFAASIAAVAACGGSTESVGQTSDQIVDNGGGPEDPGQPMPMYGMPAPEPPEEDVDGGAVAAMYGMPAPEPPEPPEVKDAGAVAPMYGMPAPATDAGAIMPMYGMPAGEN